MIKSKSFAPLGLILFIHLKLVALSYIMNEYLCIDITTWKITLKAVYYSIWIFQIGNITILSFCIKKQQLKTCRCMQNQTFVFPRGICSFNVLNGIAHNLPKFPLYVLYMTYSHVLPLTELFMKVDSLPRTSNNTDQWYSATQYNLL